jgi:hypothetical protein
MSSLRILSCINADSRPETSFLRVVTVHVDTPMRNLTCSPPEQIVVRAPTK